MRIVSQELRPGVGRLLMARDLDMKLGDHYFLCRVDDQNPAHTRFSVFAGSMDHARGHAGHLVMRNAEWEDFRTTLTSHSELIEALQAFVNWDYGTDGRGGR